MMFDWNDQDQVGDTIWAEFSGTEDHIVPYPRSTEDNNNNNNTNSNPNNNTNNNNINNYPNYVNQDKTKQNQNEDMETWSDLPSLSGLNNRDFNNVNIEDTSEYLNDFESDPNLDKVQVQLEGETEAFGNGNEGENNNASFLDCDWGNIGDFDDFDHLFSNGDSIFGNENEGAFLSHTSDVINSTSLLPCSGDQASGNGSSSVQVNEVPAGRSNSKEKAEKDNNNKKLQQKSRKKSVEKGKNKMTVLPLHNASQVPVMQVNSTGFPFSGFAYPESSFPGIPVLPKPADKMDNNNQVVMTPQEKIEKLRRRQQMQALLAIQKQQQELGHQVSGNDNLVPQVSSSPRNMNPDSVTASSALLDGSANKGSTSGATTVQDDFLKEEDTHVEETIYHQLQEALAKLDVRVRLCIRDSLLRLARSAMERQQQLQQQQEHNTITADTRSGNNNSNNNNNMSGRDDNDISYAHSNIAMRFPMMIEEETGTNRIDRTVAHLLFHNLSDKSLSASFLKDDPPLSPLSFNSDSEVSGAKMEENRQNGSEMEVDMIMNE